MAETPFKLDIVTPEKVVYSLSDVVSVIVPGEEGYFGIMAGHAPLISKIHPGELHLRRAGMVEELVSTSGGFVEVTPERVTVLADTAETPEDIDVERAKAAYKRASELLTYLPPGTDIDRARLAKERAAARLRVAGVALPK